MTDQILPAGFDALQPFVARWAVPTSAQRAALRDQASADDCKALMAAIMPLADQALDYLDGQDINNFSSQDQNLMDLMLGAAHASLVVEVQGPDEPKHSQFRHHMVITQTPADR